MDYRKIAGRGSVYINAAGNNWHRRVDRIMKAWYKGHPKTALMFRLVDDLEARINRLRGIIFDAHKQRIEQERQAAELNVMLECPSWECQDSPEGVITVIRLADYAEGKYKCGKCGEALEMRGSKDIDIMLYDLGVNTAPES